MKKASLAILAIILLTNQAMSAEGNDTLLLQGQNYIKLDRHTTDTTINNQHPYKLSEKEVCALLRYVTISFEEKKLVFFDKERAETAMFNEQELKILCSVLPKAFSKSSPDKDIVFAVSSLRTAPSGIGSNTLITSARTFIDDDYMNIIFKHVREDYNKLFDREYYGEKLPKSDYIPQRKMETHPVDAGSRQHETKQEWKLAEKDFINYRHDRSDWIQIDINKLLASKLLPINETNHPGKNTEQQATSRLQKERRQKNNNQEDSSIEARLRKLKALYEKDLISEDVYQKKMNSIIKEL